MTRDHDLRGGSSAHNAISNNVIYNEIRHRSRRIDLPLDIRDNSARHLRQHNIAAAMYSEFLLR